MNPLGDAATFLIETLFGLYILAVMLRFLLQLFRADFYNPVSQFLVKVTHPVLRPLRRVVPSMGNIDTASIVLMLLLQFAELWLVSEIRGSTLSALTMLILAFAILLKTLLYVFIVAILIRIVLSWLGPQGPNPVLSLLHSLTEPLLGRARRMLPALSIGGFDLTPIVVLIVLQLGLILLVQPIAIAAYRAAGVG